MKRILLLSTFFALSMMPFLGVSATVNYTLYIENLPSGAAVTVGGVTYSQSTTEGIALSADAELSANSVKATSAGGCLSSVSVDNANHQINVTYTQVLVPSTVENPVYNYCYNPATGTFVKNDGSGNLMSSSGFYDKLVFVESPVEGGDSQYYIYDADLGKYIYYTGTSNGSITASQSTSNVRLTTSIKTAKTWTIVWDDLTPNEDAVVDVVPGSVSNATTSTPGWNFTGGLSYVLNLYTMSDSNGKWVFTTGVNAQVPCATRVYSLPGQPFMHKLPMYSGTTLTGVSNLPVGLTLKEDRPAYKYISGIAPLSEGTYTYTLNMVDESDNETSTDVSFVVSSTLAQPTPFMGILTWNAFQSHISSATIEEISDALVAFDLDDLGYNHMCIDDEWAQSARDADGRLQVNTSKFNDWKGMIEHVHANGHKIGIYSDAGSRTCSGAQPGSLGSELTDAQSFKDWGFDLLKYDNCYGSSTTNGVKKNYTAMGDALAQAFLGEGKTAEDLTLSDSFLYYLCEWGSQSPYLWGAQAGGSCWRTTEDTRDYWSDTTYKGGIKQSIQHFMDIWAYNGVNRFNDADMLVVGLHGTGYSSNDGGGDGYSAGLNLSEARTNFSLWCMWNSPLTLSNNITNLDGKENTLTGKTVTNTNYANDLSVIRNQSVIELDQDPLGQCAEPVEYTENEWLIMQKDLADGGVAISVTNLGSATTSRMIDFSMFTALQPDTKYIMTDLWKKGSEQVTLTNGVTYTPYVPLVVDGTFTKESTYDIKIGSHVTFVYRLTPMKSYCVAR